MNDILFKSSTNIEMKKKLEVKAAFIYRRILELSSSLMRLHIKGEKRQRRGEHIFDTMWRNLRYLVGSGNLNLNFSGTQKKILC